MNILSIGNSFSQDAQRYLHQVARAGKAQLEAVNAYIGGCTLYTHYTNMLSGKEVYSFEINGHKTHLHVSLKEALLNREWDVVTLQQASHKSVSYDTYQPYLNSLVEYVKLHAPKSKIAIHQTWAYEQDSKRLNDELGYANQADMFADIKASYAKAFKDIGADILIPSGEVFQSLLSEGIPKVHRDTFHASLGIGRYALALLWYSVLTQNDVMNNSFNDFDEEITPEQIQTVKRCVSEICAGL